MANGVKAIGRCHSAAVERLFVRLSPHITQGLQVHAFMLQQEPHGAWADDATLDAFHILAPQLHRVLICQGLLQVYLLSTTSDPAHILTGGVHSQVCRWRSRQFGADCLDQDRHDMLRDFVVAP